MLTNRIYLKTPVDKATLTTLREEAARRNLPLGRLLDLVILAGLRIPTPSQMTS